MGAHTLRGLDTGESGPVLDTRIELLVEDRAAAGLSQDELGARMGGLTRSGVSNVETGRRAVLAHNVVRYAAVLAVEPLWLLTGHPAVVDTAKDGTEPVRAAR